ncbi:LpqB family beta-propeller domain-containing protein [Microbacterium sp.]|uniref:LpqB family beta-propeller domain-containing protein n=1 Tax=Microbacterium sp. TaxID=51671 RepID=UPI003A89C128
MSARRAAVTAMVGALLVVLLTACAGLPVSGPVTAGGPIADDDRAQPDFSFVPDGPSPEATPEQIVEGFILAASGSRDNWRIAREFLATDYQDQWQPGTGVIVYTPGTRSAVRRAGEAEFELTVTTEATVDASGVYTVASDRDVSLSYRLAEDDDGQWRITAAPDGIVLDANRFASVFAAYSLMFFDPSGEYLVPDVRWFPVTNSATSIAVALVDGGPSPALADAVRTAFTDAARLERSAVPERSGVAEVALQSGALDLDQRVLDRMQTQLTASLATAGVQGVEMVVDGALLPATGVQTRSTRVDSRALVSAGGEFGFLSVDEVEPIGELSAAVSAHEPTAVEIDAEGRDAAVRTADGTVVRVSADGGQTWQLDDRPGLIPPTLDTWGWVWSVPTDDPAAVVAYDAAGAPRRVEGAWPGATRIAAMRVSRDGARVAALVRDGERYAVWVSAIARDDEGAPVELGDRTVMATLDGDGVALSWLGSSRVVAVTMTDSEAVVTEQGFGGTGDRWRVPAEVVAVAGGNQTGSVRLLTATGDLYQQVSGSWSLEKAEVSVLGMPRGLPR